MKFPDFFVIGAAKAGTTTIYEWLFRHPQLYLSPIKEPNFFSTDINPENFSSIYKKNNPINLEKYFSQRPLKKIHLAFVRDEKLYQRLFKEINTEKHAGECSTSYLYSFEAARNIYSFNPEAKIIAILRQPAERAFSHYLMALKYGYVTAPFLQAFESDRKTTPKGWGISQLFYELGQYGTQLERYYQVFKPEQIKIILFEDIKDNPEKAFKEICRHLNVDESIKIPLDIPYNPARLPLSPLLMRLGKSRVLQGLFNIFPEQWYDKLKRILSYSPQEKNIRLKKEEKKYITGLYVEEIKKVEKLTGLNLSHWYN